AELQGRCRAVTPILRDTLQRVSCLSVFTSHKGKNGIRQQECLRSNSRRFAGGALALLWRDVTKPRLSRLFAAIGRMERAPEVLRCIRDCRDWPSVVPAYLGLSGLELPA